MKKEVILAITIGFGLGLIITYGIWLANKSLKNLPLQDIAPTSTPAATVSPSSQTTQASTPQSVTPTPSATSPNLTITEPVDEYLTDKNQVILKGKTTPNGVVAITSEVSEEIVTADDSGNFTATLKLEGGYNIITATALDQSGKSVSQSLTVTYTTAKI